MDAAFLPDLNAGTDAGSVPSPESHDRLLYLSPVPWQSVAQRPHELVQCFHRQTGGEVLWLDPYPTRLPRLDDLRHRPGGLSAQRQVPGWLRILAPPALPIEPLPLVSGINRLLQRRTLEAAREFARHPTLLVVGKPSLLALELLADPLLRDSRYDAMDDVAQFYEGLSRDAMASCERRAVQAAAQVWCSSRELQRRLLNMGTQPLLIPNACAAERLPPPKQPRQSDGPLVLGYLGVIAKWFDWQWVIDLASALPDAEVRLIGPQTGKPPTPLPSNIRLLPPLAHEAAMLAIGEFDIGLIPFRQSELTRSVDPVKYYEYRAMGLPVVSTVFGEMQHRGPSQGVFLATPQACLRSLVASALACPETAREIPRFRAENSWNSRFPLALFRRDGTGGYSRR